jgi:type IV secretory pathway VirD2 relaxase
VPIPDEIEAFKPRIGKPPGRAARDRAGSLRGAVLAWLGAARGYGGRSNAGGRYARAHRPDARRVVVKAHVQRLTARGAQAAKLHLRYIERDGVEKDGSKGVLYGPDAPVARETFEQPRPGEQHQFRLIVSPEDAAELDLTLYVRRLMDRVERDLGCEIEWAAVNHYDTDHPHAHVVVRGVARDGHELRFDRDYIACGMRWRAQELATQELGPRLEQDIRRAREREVAQERFTSLDREIDRIAGDNGGLEARSIARPGRVGPSILRGRLEHLERMGLAQRLSSQQWALAPEWQKELRDLGKRGDILKQIHEAIPAATRYHVLERDQPLPSLDQGQLRLGRVAAKGLSDEAKGTFYAVIEMPSGEAYHVPLDARTAETVRAGAIVSFETKTETVVRPIDNQLAKVASGGGTVSLEHVPEDGRPMVQRRLRELERQSLARPISEHVWALHPDLTKELEQRATRDPSRPRLLVRPLEGSLKEQAIQRGPAWIDRVSESSLADHGFGAEVAKALAQRRELLRGMGITPGDPNKDAKLRECERLAVGRGIAERSGQKFLTQEPERFAGRLRIVPARQGGASYAVVTDGVSFVLRPASAELRTLSDQFVTLSRDGQVRSLARGVDRDMGR